MSRDDRMMHLVEVVGLDELTAQVGRLADAAKCKTTPSNPTTRPIWMTLYELRAGAVFETRKGGGQFVKGMAMLGESATSPGRYIQCVSRVNGCTAWFSDVPDEHNATEVLEIVLP